MKLKLFGERVVVELTETIVEEPHRGSSFAHSSNGQISSTISQNLLHFVMGREILA